MSSRSRKAVLEPAYSSEEEEELELEDDEEDEWEQERQGTSRTRTGLADQNDDDDDDEEDGVAQFEDDEGEMIDSDDEETGLHKQLASIPFGTLVKAQKKLHKSEKKASKARAQSQQDSGSDDDTEQNDRPRSIIDRKGKGKPKRRENDGRTNKHAPMEISSKKPVGRTRQVVEVQAKKARDPRFDSLSGAVKPDQFSKSYSFLQDQQTLELETLRKTVAIARKKGSLLPEEEREKLEDALQRMESREISRKNKKRDEEALRVWKKEEEKKRGEGKKEFYLKSSDQKAVLLKAKFDVLAQDKKQLRKTIEKKRKKIAQKDKKLLPQKR